MDGTGVKDLTAEQRLQLLVAGIRDYAIYLLDPEGHVSSWNAGAERFKGYTADEIIGQHFSRFFTEEDRVAGRPAAALRTALAEGKFEAEGWRLRKDGSRFWASVVLDAIHDEGGHFIGFAKITRDITERRAAQEALRESQEALQRANAALFQSQKMQAIGQLTGGIAHDFNNLLAVLSSGLDVMAMSPDARGDPALMETMRRAVSRGSTLTQQLLAFARKQPLKPEYCNLNALVGGFESVLRRAVPSSIEFAIELAPALGTVSVDAQRLEAALLNLVVNSRDAMPDGGVLLLRTESVSFAAGDAAAPVAPGEYARLSVVDTGCGMSADVQSRAFEPFFTTKAVGRGTGLGLSQVYGFITQSGGDIVLSSEAGQGTSIAIYLPLVPGEAAEAREPESDKVLIVEDEPELLALAASLFRSIGYEVLTANDGVEAMRVFEREPGIGILFSDVVMPHMNGIDLARWASEHHPNVKVVLTSGYPMPALAEQHADFDRYAFVNKPYRLAELAKALRTA